MKIKPALTYHFLTGIYDKLTTYTFSRTSFRKVFSHVYKSLQLDENRKLLEFGCGPGRLAMHIKKKNPVVELLALDADPQILEIAKRNAEQEGIEIDFQEADITRFKSKKIFDCAYSTLVFHHLSAEGKEKALQSIRNSLRPGGSFILADFCEPKSLLERLRYLVIQGFDGPDTTTPHRDGWLEKNLPLYFKKVNQVARVSTFLGPVGVFVCTENRK